MAPSRFKWTVSGHNTVNNVVYLNYKLYDEQDETYTSISFDTSTRQVSLLSNYNEIAIRSHDGRMYFNNLCVNIEIMNESLKENHKNINDNIENFKSFIDACLKTGSQDIVIFRNKKEEELANNANNKFWLKSSPLVKEKITFLEFIDKYCKDFQQHFTDEQKQQIEKLRNKNKIKQKEQNKQNNRRYELDNQPKDIHASISSTKNNNVSLFGLGCYQISIEERDDHYCGGCFW